MKWLHFASGDGCGFIGIGKLIFHWHLLLKGRFALTDRHVKMLAIRIRNAEFAITWGDWEFRNKRGWL